MFAALMVCEHNLVSQGQQARMYSLFLLVLLITLNYALDVFKNSEPGRKELLKLGLCLGVLGWTHQLMISIWISCAISLTIHAWQTDSSRTLKAWFQKTWRLNLQVFLVASLINLPNLLLLLRRINDNYPAEITATEISRNLLFSLEYYLGDEILGGLVFLAACLGWWRISMKISRAYACLLLTTFHSTLFIYVRITEHHHFVTERYLLAIVPPIQIGVCMLFVDQSVQKTFRIGGFLIVLFLLGRTSLKTYEINLTHNHPHYLAGAAAQVLAEKMQTGDSFLTYPNYHRPLVGFYQQKITGGANQPIPIIPNWSDFEIASPPGDQDFWLLLDHFEIMNPQHPEELDQKTQTISTAYHQSFSLKQIPDPNYYCQTIIHFSNHRVECWNVRQNPNRKYQVIPVNLLSDKAP
ncbi:MAG: hypothetical protein P8M30_04485 [Planctomycetaceae bacterium]|nr:hypothetical protein [bacterium]MDC0274452.1 hypothetical protein [Planctomycetaceae bacterium]MDC0308449.1 hypothetical protein [Planctomycetaceae bacterium]MDG2388557.1 hypothetical protein [Planctomycetaceae bacterium]